MPANKPHIAMMNRMLKTADPTIVPVPTSDLAKNTPGISRKVHVNVKPAHYFS